MQYWHDRGSMAIITAIIYTIMYKSCVLFGTQDGLWGNWSSDNKLITHVCPPSYCDCEQTFQNGSGDVGCYLDYNDPSSICDNTRAGILSIHCMHTMPCA